ncbi:hypothetical protein N7522_008824 [Penicillium canescens]|nr:hypothetical protein N7522_008824 [Penicillium canescens]
MTNIVARYRAALDTVARDVDPTTACFANTVQPLIEVENEMQGKLAMVAMLRYASPEKAAREASEEALQLFSEAESDFVAREDLYLLVKAVRDKAEPLDFESQKYLDELLKDYTRCGHGLLWVEDIEQYLNSRNTIDMLRRNFIRNLMDNVGGIWLTESDLDGVHDADMLRFHRKSERPANDYFIPFTKHDVATVLKYAKIPATRKRLYTANDKKAEENVSIFKDVILRRDNNARMLGYPSHAAFRLEKRVAKTTAWVHHFLDNLQDILLPKGRKEMEFLLKRKRNYLRHSKYPDEHPDIMPPWDFKFYIRLAEEELDVQHKKIAEYFPLQTVIASMLRLFAHCLRLRFESVAPEHLAHSSWHEDVEAWSVWDESSDARGSFIGHLYADLLSRPNKYRGSQDVNIQCSYIQGDGNRVYPTTLLMCSFPRPTATACALLEHKDVVSLFHELGHGMHDLLARTKYTRFHGWRAPPDFAEAPSVMLENWCWIKDELRQMSCHYTSLDSKLLEDWQLRHPGLPVPPTQIPDELLDPLVESRNHNRALWLLSQLAVSRFDMEVHDPPSHEACEAMDPTTLFNQVDEKLTLQPIPDREDRGHPHVHFGHLLSGYDAGYYSYLSAQVFAADLFESTFAADPRCQPLFMTLADSTQYASIPNLPINNWEHFESGSPNSS